MTVLKLRFPKTTHNPLCNLQKLVPCNSRVAWKSPDERTRDWYIFVLRRAHALVEGGIPRYPEYNIPQMKDLDWEWWTPPPKVTPFEAVLYYFQSRVGDFAKHCAHVDCPAPYFIAEKRAQKFCSEKCAGPANRESKRKWWNENRGKGVSR